MVTKLSDFLGNALEDATSLEVATYVSEDMTNVEFKDGQFTGAKLRALTHVNYGDAKPLRVGPELPARRP